MEKKLSPKAWATKEKIIEAFWSLYCHKRIEKITVKEICLLSGYNRSTFYDYFKDVYEVLEEIEERTVSTEDFKELILEQIIQNRASIGEVLLNSVLTLFEKNSKYLPILLGEQGDPLFRNKLLKKLTPVVLSIYKDLSDEEVIEVRYLMEYQSAAMLSTISRWYAEKKVIPKEKFIKLLLSVTTNGVQKELSKYLQ
ncbi:TetR/AcrR family transcriptional regulator [Eubacteriaceae bacterium ES3]|nr:TetR/AcrR family transcriptional regulator [Eubacteriaceae bacterium ES3]